MDTTGALKISPLLLLGIYSIAPLLLLLVLVDVIVLDRMLQTMLPATPQMLFWFVLLFNVPHHVASLFSLADKEYLAFYKEKLIPGLPLLLLSFGVLLWYAPAAALVAFIVYTEYHVMSQHEGILRMMSRTHSLLHRAWKWTGIALLAIGYGLTSLSTSYSAFLESIYAYTALPALLVFFIALSGVLLVRVPSGYSRWFVALVTTTVLGGLLFLGAGYVFFAILVGRFVHDVAAFAFYTTHDHNRSLRTKTNLLYRMFSFTKLPVFLLVPVLAVALAYLLQHLPLISGAGLLFLFLTHYYVEGFIWKGPTPHRTFVTLSS